MTTSIPTRGDADLDREIGDRCRVYQEAYGFHTSRYLGPEVIGVIAGQVSAVIVPRQLGVQMREMLAWSVPIFSVDRDIWVFLTAGPTDHADSLEMFRYGALVPSRGALIALPTPGISRRCWMQPPVGRCMPTFTLVADTVIVAAGSRT